MGVNAGSVYGVEQTEDGFSISNTEASGKKLEKDLKPRSMKGDLSEPLSQYDLNSYPSKSKIIQNHHIYLLINMSM